MNLKTIFGACSKMCKSLAKNNPERSISTDEGKMTLVELSEELDNLCNWCYSGSIDVQKVIRCKNCKHYRKFKKNNEKHPYEHDVVMLCRLTKTQRQPEFFCSDAEERKL